MTKSSERTAISLKSQHNSGHVQTTKVGQHRYVNTTEGGNKKSNIWPTSVYLQRPTTKSYSKRRELLSVPAILAGWLRYLEITGLVLMAYTTSVLHNPLASDWCLSQHTADMTEALCASAERKGPFLGWDLPPQGYDFYYYEDSSYYNTPLLHFSANYSR